MSVAYGGPPGSAGYQPTGRVNFGWISEAFGLFKANAVVWIVAALMAAVPSIIGGIIGGVYGVSSARSGSFPQPSAGQSPFGGGQNPFASTLPPGLMFGIDVFSVLYIAWFYSGAFYTAVKQVRGETISIGDIFTGAPRMWSMLGFHIVYGLAVGIGIVLCVVPGFLLGGLLFPCYALIADGETFGNAISRSIDAMKRDMWNAGAFVFVMGLLVLASAIPCGLGLLVTVPMAFLTAALAYRDMIGMPGSNQAGPSYGGTAPGVWPPAPGAWPPPPQAYPPPQAPPPPRQSLSGEPLDDPGQTPPDRGQ